QAVIDYEEGRWDDAGQSIQTWRELHTVQTDPVSSAVVPLFRAAICARKGELESAPTWDARANEEQKRSPVRDDWFPVDSDARLTSDIETALGLNPPSRDANLEANLESTGPSR